MALENTDVFPIYRGSDPVPHRKASIGALLTRIGDIPTVISDLSDVDTFGVDISGFNRFVIFID